MLVHVLSRGNHKKFKRKCVGGRKLCRMQPPTRAYLRERSGISGQPQIARDAVIAVIGAVVGWFAPDSASRGEMSLYAAGGAIGAVLAFEFVAYAWRFVWVAPKQMHFEGLATIVRLEGERDEARRAGDVVRERAERDEARIRDLEAQATVLMKTAAEKTVREDWQRLATAFRAAPGFEVRADWSKASSGAESWEIRGGPEDCRECETLCRQAGTMLMKSPHILQTLPGSVQSHTNPLWRWLEFIKEQSGGLSRASYGMEQHDGGEQKPVYFGSLADVKAKSARACVDCATSEMHG
jgi:hypothetical protein